MDFLRLNNGIPSISYHELVTTVHERRTESLPERFRVAAGIGAFSFTNGSSNGRDIFYIVPIPKKFSLSKTPLASSLNCTAEGIARRLNEIHIEAKQRVVKSATPLPYIDDFDLDERGINEDPIRERLYELARDEVLSREALFISKEITDKDTRSTFSNFVDTVKNLFR